MDVGGFVNRRKKGLKQQFIMLKELVQNPRGMGALCPSSDALAGEMAGAVSHLADKDGLFVEIGAGTGPVTAALLRRGIPSGRLIVIEKSPALAECLVKRFPNVNVRCCGAEEMSGCLNGQPRVNAIISSLPFRSLPKGVSESIMNEVERVLSYGGVFVQFTYAIVGEMPFIPSGFRKVRSHIVLFNIPPAKVEVYQKSGIKGEMPD
jgi:phosphatidylethanolamine/phosphatidyl-N-methylethanolamine N-methyltransferase